MILEIKWITVSVFFSLIFFHTNLSILLKKRCYGKNSIDMNINDMTVISIFRNRKYQLKFSNIDSLCDYHCNFDGRRETNHNNIKEYHKKNKILINLCNDTCICDYFSSYNEVNSRNRLLSETINDRNKTNNSNIPLTIIKCGDLYTLDIEIKNKNKLPFHDFFNNFKFIHKNMLHDNGSFFGGCELSLLKNDTTDLYTTNYTKEYTYYRKPYYLQLHYNLSDLEEDECVVQIKEEIGSSVFRIISHKTNHNNFSFTASITINDIQAEKIRSLTCVRLIIPTPALLKITPFARSSNRIHLIMNESFVGPSLMIKISPDIDPKEVLYNLNNNINSKIGILNTIHKWEKDTKINDENNDFIKEKESKSSLLIMKAMENVELWAFSLSVIISNEYVEWVDLIHEIVTTSINIDATKGLNHQDFSTKRHLDDFIPDVLGVREAQKAGITGLNTIVGITDTGLYIDHDQFDQESRKFYNKIDTSARKVILYETFGDSYDQSEAGTCGHGTHVSGIVAGSSYSQKSTNWGIAFDAKIAFMDIGTQSKQCITDSCGVLLKTPLKAADLLSNQIRAGAKIFTFSWGTMESDYSSQSQDIDDFLFDNKDIIILVAAGNSGETSPGVISSPGGAKNVITIGASLNSASSFYRLGILSCPNILNEDTLAAFSSNGPTSDGRMKPDIVAPGQILTSAKSLTPGSTFKTDASCQLQGTSQATPAAAGVAILLHEWLRDGWWKTGRKNASYSMKNIPSSLIKALLIHSSINLERRLKVSTLGSCGSLTNSIQKIVLPDSYQGYGRPVLSNLASFINNNNISESIKEKVFFLPNSSNSIPVIENKAYHYYNFTIRKGQFLRVTIVWTDTAGSLFSTRLLQRDLDLSLKVYDTIFYPISSGGTGPDRLNNVEVIKLSYDQVETAYYKYYNNSNHTSNNITNGTEEYKVLAIVYGYSILGGTQEYSIVASSSAVDSSVTGGINTNNKFWKTWMTYVAIGIGSLSFIVFSWFFIISKFINKKRKDTIIRPRPQQRQVNPPIAYPGYISQDSIDLSGIVVNNNINTNNENICPFCYYKAANPIILVNHVEHMHPQN